MPRRLNHLKTLKSSGYTTLALVKDIDDTHYYVKKSLSVPLDFQKRMFENEINMHSRFNDKYIINFVQRTGPFEFLMEYAAKGNLENILHSNTDDSYRIKVSIQVLKGLAYMHDAGFIHNDIKPTNILIDKDKRARLSDFAFTGRVGDVGLIDPPEYFRLGTDFFRRPEINSPNELNRVQNDIYSFGVVLYMLFAHKQDMNTINIDRITNPTIKSVTQRCLTGNFTNIAQIIIILNELTYSDRRYKSHG